MKYVILFAFAAFAILARVDAAVVTDMSLERGAIIDALKEKLRVAKEKLDDMLNKAQDTLKEKLAEAKEKAERLIEKLKEKANEIGDQVFVAVQQILDKVSVYEDKLVEQAKHILSKHDKSIAENEIETD